MATPGDYVKSLQKEGVMLVIDETFYFVPLVTLKSCKMPDEFQRGFEGVSGDYFSKEGQSDGSSEKSKVFRGMNRVLAEAFVTDGVSQAVWLDAAAKVGAKLVSKTAQSEQPLFSYSEDKTKIVVDMSRGGRPSDR